MKQSNNYNYTFMKSVAEAWTWQVLRGIYDVWNRATTILDISKQDTWNTSLTGGPVLALGFNLGTLGLT